MFKVILTKQTQTVGFSAVSGEEACGVSFTTKEFNYSNREAAEEIKRHAEENHGYSVEIVETSEPGGWENFKADVFDYYEQKDQSFANRRFKRQVNNYSRRNRWR